MLEGLFLKKSHHNNIIIYGVFSGLLLLAISLVLFIRVAFAGDLVVSPSSSSVAVGGTIPVAVVVSSTDQPMNAVDGTLSFPTDLLSVASISKAGSIIDFWVEPPSFSNTKGTVSFQGTVLNTGYKGSRGVIITVNFKAKSAGVAKLKFNNGVVLANDGEGTEITKQLIPSSITIDGNKVEELKPVVTTSSDNLPIITSTTHPDQNKWYPRKDVDLAWEIPAGVTAVRHEVNSKPSSVPNKEYPSTFASRTITGLDDGVWYAHVQFKNSDGLWGPVGHFAIKIDTVKPDKFEVGEVARQPDTNPNVKLSFVAHDETSGIDHYSVGVDSKDNNKDWVDDGTGIYSTAPLLPGNHTLYLKAVDRAGNYREASFDVNIGALVKPILINVPESVVEKTPFSVSGTSEYPNSKIKVSFYDRQGNAFKEFDVVSDGAGSFVSTVVDGLQYGKYSVRATAFGSDGSRSEPSDPKYTNIRLNLIARIGQIVQALLMVFIVIALLIAILFMILLFIKRKTKEYRELVHKEAVEADKMLHSVFKVLKDDLRSYLKKLENARAVRQLTAEEDELLEQLKSDLDNAEKSVDKEIRDIEDMSK